MKWCRGWIRFRKNDRAQYSKFGQGEATHRAIIAKIERVNVYPTLMRIFSFVSFYYSPCNATFLARIPYEIKLEQTFNIYSHPFAYTRTQRKPMPIVYVVRSRTEKKKLLLILISAAPIRI